MKIKQHDDAGTKKRTSENEASLTNNLSIIGGPAQETVGSLTLQYIYTMAFAEEGLNLSILRSRSSFNLKPKWQTQLR